MKTVTFVDNVEFRYSFPGEIFATPGEHYGIQRGRKGGWGGIAHLDHIYLENLNPSGIFGCS